MYLFAPIAISSLLLVVTTWIGWRYFSSKSNNIQQLTIEASTKEYTESSSQHSPLAREKSRIQSRLSSSTKVDRIIIRLIKLTAWPLASLLLISITSLFVFSFNEKHKIEDLRPKQYAYSARIKLTLEEELLVPPPPLPPEAFVDVISERPSLNTANRDWALLDAVFVQKVLHVMEKLKVRGYPMTLLEGYRSPERQNALAGQATLVTNAKGGQSKHQYGLAVDLAPIKNSKIIISEKDPWALEAYQALGEEAQAVGLTWGGVWRFRDYGHIEKSGPLHKQQGSMTK